MAKEPIWMQPAPAVEHAARALIAAHYPDLAAAKLLYLETNAKAKCAPKVLVPFERYLSSGEEADVDEGHDLVLVVNDVEWAYFAGRGKGAALVDHQLAHVVAGTTDDGSRVWTIGKHTVEEFPEVVQRHGLWHPRLQAFGAVARQLRLVEGGDGVAAEAVGA